MGVYLNSSFTKFFEEISMGQHSYYAYGNASQKWWEKKLVGKISRNDALYILMTVAIVVVFMSLNWDRIFGFR